jgi:hypothetical protein
MEGMKGTVGIILSCCSTGFTLRCQTERKRDQGYKGKRPGPYTREEVLEKRFTELLQGISFSQEVLTWVTQALRESHGDDRKCHEEAIARLQREHRRVQDRIGAMYMDKLDGRIDNDFFDRKAAELRSEQCRIMRDIETHQNANQSYIEEGIKLLDLARRAHVFFENQLPAEKRKLLDFVLSNCRWKAGHLEAEYRKPFDMLAVIVAAQNAAGEGIAPGACQNENWLLESHGFQPPLRPQCVDYNKVPGTKNYLN